MNIKDIANLCGVSPSTVSKILHNKDADISVETRKKVLEIIKEYQYVPYSKVINSAAPKTNMIGVLLAENTYGVQDMLYSIEKAASKNGYGIMLCNTAQDEKKAEKYYQIFNNKGVDGIISICQDTEPPEEMKIPIVRIQNREREIKNAAADLYFDMKESGYLAVSYLLEMGHERIACLLEKDEEDIREGYRGAYKERFVSPDEEWIFMGTEEEIEREGIARCLKADVTAIVCSSAEMGNAVYEKVRERGDGIPNKMSVISTRDSALAEKIYPKLTAVHVPMDEIGARGVNVLIQMMEDRKSAHEFKEKISQHICERSSVSAPSGHERGGKIVVVGSMNMDCMIGVSRIPTVGETVKAGNIISLPGGKGANQAVGAGKLEGLVYMIGRLGNDSDGKTIYNSLVNSGVKTEGVVFDDSVSTGRAYVNVASGGDSTIVIYPGANAKLDCSQINQYERLLEGAAYCLLTSEIPEETVEYTIEKCREMKVPVILKPSSVERMKESLFQDVDYFIPNEKEAELLVPQASSVEERADIFIRKGVKNVIITLGQKGCYLKNAKYQGFVPTAGFHPVDSTGAADAFISALAVSLSEGNEIRQAISFASYAAGISSTRQGVQPAMVDRRELSLYQEEIEKLCAGALSD